MHIEIKSNLKVPTAAFGQLSDYEKNYMNRLCQKKNRLMNHEDNRLNDEQKQFHRPVLLVRLKFLIDNLYYGM
jgi:hypothetical protein